jgi:hypothetical protein
MSKLQSTQPVVGEQQDSSAVMSTKIFKDATAPCLADSALKLYGCTPIVVDIPVDSHKLDPKQNDYNRKVASGGCCRLPS